MVEPRALILVAAAVCFFRPGPGPLAQLARPSSTVTHVVVKKSERTMQLFAGATVVASYSVAVGKGGAGHKRMEGDNVTPVGHYHVVKHLPSHLRVFLELDYPNQEDRARFEELKRSGAIPKDARIGGDIGIHGEPPWAKPFKKAEYQSQGCVVLEDAEIDRVSAAIPDGTPVDIQD